MTQQRHRTARTIARNSGEVFYDTGILCKNGHKSKRYVSNGKCCTCLVEEIKDNANKPGYRAKRNMAYKKWASKNREALRAYAKKKYESNREALIQKAKNYYATNRMRVLMRAREYRQKHGDVVRKKDANYKISHRDVVYANCAKRRAYKRKCAVNWADKDKIRAFYALSGKLSKSMGVRYSVDHIIPMKNATICGLHCEANLRVIPAWLNNKKSNEMLDDGIDYGTY